MSFFDSWRVKRTYFGLSFCIPFLIAACLFLPAWGSHYVEGSRAIFSAVILVFIVLISWWINYHFQVNRLVKKYPLIFTENGKIVVYDSASEKEWKTSPNDVRFRHLKLEFKSYLRFGEAASFIEIFKNFNFKVSAGFGYLLADELEPSVFCSVYKSDVGLSNLLSGAGKEILIEVCKKVFSFQNGIITYKNGLTEGMAKMNFSKLFCEALEEKIRIETGVDYIKIDLNEQHELWWSGMV